METKELVFYGIAFAGGLSSFGIIGWWLGNLEKCNKKLEEWEKAKRKIDELIEKSPSVSINKQIVVGAIQHGKTVVNEKAKKVFKEAEEKWESYKDSVTFYKVFSIIPVSLAIANVIFSVYLIGSLFLNLYDLAPSLRAYKEPLGLYILMCGWLFGTATILAFAQPPKAPDEKVKETIRTHENNRNSSDELTLAAAGVEPYASIYGLNRD